MPSYVNIPIETDPDAIVELAFDKMEELSGGLWTPADGNLDVWILIACAHMAAEARDLASDVPTTIFRYLGSQIFGIQPLLGTNAVGTTTWVMRDGAGYIVPGGTVVGIRNADGDLVYFETISDAQVVGSTTTVVGVEIASIEETASANSLTGPTVELIDSLDYVAGITLTVATHGGEDDEDDDAYIDRLTRNMALLAPRPILPDDFAQMARNIAGVYRAVAIDGYNPVDGTFNNERMVAVTGIDSSGAAISALVKTAVGLYLEANREFNFVVNMIDPTFNDIDVTWAATAYPQYDSNDVRTRGNQALKDYLNALAWGLLDSGDALDWINQTIIEEYELATVLNNVQGLNRVTGLTFAKTGNVLAQAPVNLTGVVPLPRAGAINGAVV